MKLMRHEMVLKESLGVEGFDAKKKRCLLRRMAEVILKFRDDGTFACDY